MLSERRLDPSAIPGDEKNRRLLGTTRHGLRPSLARSDRWLLNYEHEAENFGLDVKHNEVPKSLQPIVLGYCHLVNECQFHIDVRSFERAARMIEFIDRRVGRQWARVTHAVTYNRAGHARPFQHLLASRPQSPGRRR